MNPSSVRPPGFPIPSPAAGRVLPVNQNALPPLTVGEILKAEVLEAGGGKSCLISLKDATILARSEAALRAGDPIVVRVERLLPQVVLTILETDGGERSVPGDDLRWHRSNPDALRNMFAQMAEMFRPESLAGLSRYLDEGDVRSILRLTESLFFSKESLGKGLFLRDYAENLGLFWEGSPGKAPGRQPDAAGRRSLKGLLMKVLGDLRNAAEGKAASEGEKAGLQRLMEFLDTSVKAIEAHQVLNSLCQERDQGFLLQIPFAFPEGVKTGDVFIRRDDRSAGPGGGDAYEVIVLLHMDALGRVVVEARLRGGEITCLIRCESPEVRDVISGCLDELKGAVRAAGLRVESVGCLAQVDLEERCEAFYRDRLFQGDAVNLFA